MLPYKSESLTMLSPLVTPRKLTSDLSIYALFVFLIKFFVMNSAQARDIGNLVKDNRSRQVGIQQIGSQQHYFGILGTKAASPNQGLRSKGPGVAELDIETEEKESVQAAQYLNAEELKEFLILQLSDSNSDLSKLTKEIVNEACPPQNKSSGEEPEVCGFVQWSTYTQTEFERGGWQDGSAEWTLFVGYRFRDTGKYYRAAYAIRIRESVEAQVNKEGEYTGHILKTYTLLRIHPFWNP